MEINGINYELIKNYRDGFSLEDVTEALTDYYYDYDYVVGDWAYGKLRLKGFNDKKNKKFNKINDSALIDSYIENNCAYGYKHFILKKIEKK